MCCVVVCAFCDVCIASARCVCGLCGVERVCCVVCLCVRTEISCGLQRKSVHA